MTVRETCLKAKENSGVIATACEKDMNAMLAAAAVALRANAEYIIGENKKDVDSCTRGEQFKDRLMLDEKRIDGIARGLEKLTEIECPVGEILEERTLYNGLKLQRVRVPMGVLGIIYEARPNVTADAIALAIKSGNAVVLRGSKDAYLSNAAVTKVIKDAIGNIGYNAEFIQLIEDVSHEGAAELMRMNGVVDVLIPRGQRGADSERRAERNRTHHRDGYGKLPRLYGEFRRPFHGAAHSDQFQDAAHVGVATPAKACFG